MLTQTLVGEAIGQAMQSERLPRPALLARQQQKLRELVRFAAAHSPFYARHYRTLDLERVALTELPPVTKPLIQSHFDEVMTDRRLTLAGVRDFCQGPAKRSPWYLGEFAILLSSGTSGQRGYFVLDGPALADAIAQGYRQSNRGAGPPSQSPPHRIAAVMLAEPFDAAGLLLSLVPESLGPKLIIDIRQDFDEICRQLNEFQPSVLSSFPYLLRMLSRAARQGQLQIRPKRITSSGDVLTDSDRAHVHEAFGVELHNYYCSTEVPYLAWECDSHDGLHVNADYVLVESVDSRNNPVPLGRLGDRLLVTNLSNRAMPLIRYEMADQVEFSDEPCRCGCLLPRIRRVAGRVEHILSLPAVHGGRASLIPEHIDDFVGGLEGLDNYQVIQEERARLTVNFIPQAGAEPGPVQQRVRDALALCFERYGVAPDVTLAFHPVQHLEPVRPGANKVCHYWNRCGAEG
jgi:phenylacetate-coenzyme A ligase PaaK-like adenylate-forming protein